MHVSFAVPPGMENLTFGRVEIAIQKLNGTQSMMHLAHFSHHGDLVETILSSMLTLLTRSQGSASARAMHGRAARWSASIQ